MKHSVTFRGIDSSDALKLHLEEKLEKLEKFQDKVTEANVVLQVEGYRHITEIRFSAKKYQTVCKAQTSDMYASIDECVSKLETALRRKHAKKIKSKTHPSSP